jgi:hypothetical protein
MAEWSERQIRLLRYNSLKTKSENNKSEVGFFPNSKLDPLSSLSGIKPANSLRAADQIRVHHQSQSGEADRRSDSAAGVGEDGEGWSNDRRRCQD